MKKLIVVLLVFFAAVQANAQDKAFMENAASLSLSPQVPTSVQPGDFIMRVGTVQKGFQYAVGKANTKNGQYYVGLKYPLDRKTMYTAPLFEMPVEQPELEIDTVYYNGRGMIFVKDRYSVCGVNLGEWLCSELQEESYLARRRALYHLGGQSRVIGYTMYVLAGLLAVPGAIVLLGTDEKGVGLGLIAAGVPFYLFGKYMVSVGASTSYLASADMPNSLTPEFSTIRASISLHRSF